MRQLIPALVLLLSTTAVTAQPDKDWWACQSVEAAGLIWKNAEWQSTRFSHNERFVLIAEGRGLTKASVAKAMGDVEGALNCTYRNMNSHTFCISKYTGHSFGFDPKTGNGAIASIIGAVVSPSSNGLRDSMTLLPFECTKG